MNKTVVFVNGKKHELTSNQVLVGELITLGGGKPGEYELQKRKGQGGPVTKTFQDPNQVIEVKNGDHFTTRFTGSINPAAEVTPSSAIFGKFLTKNGIKYEVRKIADKSIYIFEYKIPNGEYTNISITLGLPISEDFPITAPYGFHIKKDHNFKENITNVNSSPLGGDWEFWSREVTNWDVNHRGSQYYLDNVNRCLELK